MLCSPLELGIPPPGHTLGILVPMAQQGSTHTAAFPGWNGMLVVLFILHYRDGCSLSPIALLGIALVGVSVMFFGLTMSSGFHLSQQLQAAPFFEIQVEVATLLLALMVWVGRSSGLLKLRQCSQSLLKPWKKPWQSLNHLWGSSFVLKNISHLQQKSNMLPSCKF